MPFTLGMDNATQVPCRPPRSPWIELLNGVLWKQPLMAVGFALFFGTLWGGHWNEYVLSYKLALTFCYCIFLCIWIAKHVFERRVARAQAGDLSVGVRIGALYLTAAIVGSYSAAFIIHRSFMPGFLGSPRAVVISGMFTLLFAGLFGGINFAIVFYRMSVERARAVELARAELAQAELRALRAQIHPHFLFNTLNTITALIASHPAEAEDTTTRLADLFRYTLAASGRESAPLGDELAFLRNYLAIEHTRFADRLRVVERIEPGLEAIPVPSLLLQPLVENAVRHAVAPRTEGGTVTLAARREGDLLVLGVEDDGPGLDENATPSGAGFGLHSVRERIRVAGPPHALAIDSAPGRGTRIRITLPISTPGAPAPVPPGAPS